MSQCVTTLLTGWAIFIGKGVEGVGVDTVSSQFSSYQSLAIELHETLINRLDFLQYNGDIVTSNGDYIKHVNYWNKQLIERLPPKLNKKDCCSLFQEITKEIHEMFLAEMPKKITTLESTIKHVSISNLNPSEQMSAVAAAQSMNSQLLFFNAAISMFCIDNNFYGLSIKALFRANYLVGLTTGMTSMFAANKIEAAKHGSGVSKGRRDRQVRIENQEPKEFARRVYKKYKATKQLGLSDFETWLAGQPPKEFTESPSQNKFATQLRLWFVRESLYQFDGKDGEVMDKTPSITTIERWLKGL